MYSGVLCRINCIHSTHSHGISFAFHFTSSQAYVICESDGIRHISSKSHTVHKLMMGGERRHRRQKGGKVRIMTNSRMHKMCDQWVSVCACVSECTSALWLAGSLALAMIFQFSSDSSVFCCCLLSSSSILFVVACFAFFEAILCAHTEEK